MRGQHGHVTDKRFDVIEQYIANGNGAARSRHELCRVEWDEPRDWTMTVVRDRPAALAATVPFVQVYIEYGNERTTLLEPISQRYAVVNLGRGYVAHGTSKWARVYLTVEQTGPAVLTAGYEGDVVQATMSMGRPSPWRTFRTAGFVNTVPDAALAQLIDPLCQDVRLYQPFQVNGIVIPQDIVMRLYDGGTPAVWYDYDLSFTGAELVVPIAGNFSHFMLYSAGGTVGAMPTLCMTGIR